MKKVILVVCVLTLVAAAGCQGVQKQGKTFVASGYSFNILFNELPANALKLAEGQIPPGGKIETVLAYPSDKESLWGILNLILGVGIAQIGGTLQ